jgi:DNA-binding MarR family transcriptional regulator
MNNIILNYPKLSRADLATLAAIEELGKETFRTCIAKKANISARQVTRACNRLEAEGLLINHRVYDRKSKKTRSTRVIHSQCDNFVTLERRQRDKIVTLPPKKIALAWPDRAKGQNCHPSCMYDDDVIIRMKESLSFFDASGFEKLLETPHLTPELAQAWADNKLWRDTNDNWGSIKKPEGYIFSQLKKGVWPVVQQELPEAVIDLTEQYEPPPGMESARYIQMPDGLRVWK